MISPTCKGWQKPEISIKEPFEPEPSNYGGGIACYFYNWKKGWRTKCNTALVLFHANGGGVPWL